MKTTTENDPISKSRSERITQRNNLAFNQGCDAALAGQDKSSCPYLRGSSRASIWMAGWKDVDANRRLGRI